MLSIRVGLCIFLLLIVGLFCIGPIMGAYTNTHDVTLSLSARDPDPGSGIAGYRLTENTAVWLPWVVIDPPVIGAQWTAAVPFTLSAGDGVKTVYVQYRDAAGNVSLTYTQTITIDSIPPVGGILIANGAITTPTPKVLLALNSPTASTMRLSNDSKKWTTWGAFTPSKQWVLTNGKGIKTVYVQYKDVNNTTSEIFKDTIILKKV